MILIVVIVGFGLENCNEKIAQLGALGSLMCAASPPVLSPAIPFDVTANPPFTLDNLQHDFDVLSWQTFVALNWPANADGSANTSAKIGAPGKTVWESWKESYEIFLPKGQKPVAWDQQAPVPEAG